MSDPVFDRIAIIGAGLIGASIARAARAASAAQTIVLYDKDPDVRQRAGELDLGVIAGTPVDAVANADAIFLSVPVGAMGVATEGISEGMKRAAILTDVGSVKGSARRAMAASCPDHAFLIPGHPIAGTEQSGPDAGFASLFEGRWHILTPEPNQSAAYDEAVSRLSTFWERLGANVEIMDAARHDQVLAITSHLPHLIAYNIVSTAFDMESVDEGEVVKYCAGGFRDFTRIAASDPIMWRDVFLNNKDAVLETLGRFTEDLTALQKAIRHGDGDMLFREFERARGIRKAILDAGQDTDDVNFGRNADPEPAETVTKAAE
ncbi:MAG: prephenate/arogenate dehydrogenase family protein [Pseudomonadota bacterium]